MNDVKLYREWEPLLEAEQDCTVCDPDGLVRVMLDGKSETLMTKHDATGYFWCNTMKFGPAWIERFKQEMAEAEESR
jgi:hypothetical protein